MERLTEREREILKILRNNPMISQEELAELVGVTRSAAAVHISNLIKKGHILGRGYVFNDKSPVFVVGPVYMEISAVNGPGNEEQIDITIGGKGQHIARSLSLLGVPVAFASVIGRDEWGETVTTGLRDLGVNTTYLLSQREFPTPRRVIFRSDSGINKVVTDGRALEKFSPDILSSMSAAIKGSRAILIDAAMSESIIHHFINLAVESDIPVCAFFADESSPSKFKFKDSRLLQAVILGMHAEKKSGIEIRDLDDGLAAGEVIANEGFESVVVIVPGQGVSCTGKNERFTVPLSPGYGDNHEISIEKLIASMTANIMHGYDLRQSLRLAMANAVHKSS